MSHLRKALRFAIVGGALAIAPGPVLAQSKPSTDSREASGPPTEAALAVGAPQIGSVANLQVAGFDIAVTAGSIVYSYYFTNKGNADLAVCRLGVVECDRVLLLIFTKPFRAVRTTRRRDVRIAGMLVGSVC